MVNNVKIRVSNLATIARLNKYQTESDAVDILVDFNPWLKPYVKSKKINLVYKLTFFFISILFDKGIK